MNTQEVIAQKVLPLADAGLVAVGFAGNGDYANLGIVRFDVGNIGSAEGDTFTLGEEGEGAVFAFVALGKPPGPLVIADGRAVRMRPRKTGLMSIGGTSFSGSIYPPWAMVVQTNW